MALKAGRVGVALDQVDDFGQIKSEATSGYTKQEADAKFETKTHAATENDKQLFTRNKICGSTGSNNLLCKLPAGGLQAQTFVGFIFILGVCYNMYVNFNGNSFITNYDDNKGNLVYDNTTYELFLNEVTQGGIPVSVWGKHI